MIRKIVTINGQKCNGCGLCVPACAEGAIAIVEGKAQLAADNLCDGLGACLGQCPQDAITIIEREADEFDEAAVELHLGSPQPKQAHRHSPDGHSQEGSGCPGSRLRMFTPKESADDSLRHAPNHLRQWPIQLHLIPPHAPFLRDADLLIAADCVPFAYAGFHNDLLRGKALAICCPKLDDTSRYREKLTELFRVAGIRSITIARMEVPCCSAILAIAKEALAASGEAISLTEVVVGIQGKIL